MNNKKNKTIIKLLCWFIIAGALLFYLQYEQRRIEKRNEEYNTIHNFDIDFNYLKNSLLNNDFDYSFIIVDNGLIEYTGKRSNGLYSGIINKKSEYSNKVEINKNYKYLLVDRILDLFKGDFESKNNSFIYEKDNLYVKIRVSINDIVNIEVNDNGIIYQLEFTNINGFDVKGSE